MCLGRRDLFLEVGRAIFALIGLFVPADLRTDPFAAAQTLMKMLLAFLDGRFERRIVRFAADGALDLIG